MFKSLICLAVASVVVAPALAQDAAPKEERKICKRFKETGSRMGGSRICKTAAEWAADAESAKKGFDTVRRGGVNGDSTPPVTSGRSGG